MMCARDTFKSDKIIIKVNISLFFTCSNLHHICQLWGKGFHGFTFLVSKKLFVSFKTTIIPKKIMNWSGIYHNNMVLFWWEVCLRGFSWLFLALSRLLKSTLSQSVIPFLYSLFSARYIKLCTCFRRLKIFYSFFQQYNILHQLRLSIKSMS